MRDSIVDAETESGPTVTPNGPDTLRELLDEFESLVQAQGSPVKNQLGVGLDRGTIVQQLTGIGIEPPEELVVWFGWHNGLAAPAGGRLRGDALPPCIIPSTLNKAIGRYYRDKDADHGEGPWDSAPGWLMLSNTTSGLAIFCSDDPDNPPRIRSVDMDHPLWEVESTQQVVSLCTAVSYWIRALELGVHSWNRATEKWDYDPSRIPPLLLRSGLVT